MSFIFNSALSTLLAPIATGFLAILVALAVLAPHSLPAGIFTLFLNTGRWEMQGVSFFIGLLGLAFSMVGADAAVHMAEEISNAVINVPRTIIPAILLNGNMGFALLLATLFVLGDVTAALETSTGYPFLEIFAQATGIRRDRADHLRDHRRRHDVVVHDLVVCAGPRTPVLGVSEENYGGESGSAQGYCGDERDRVFARAADPGFLDCFHGCDIPLHCGFL